MRKDLRKLERVWHNLGRQDPFWAALTDTDKQHGGWSRDEFFETGSAEIDATSRPPAATDGRSDAGALDFGCGAGRLTQALAARFDRVDGVDISRSMIAREAGQSARRHVPVSSQPAPDLSVFSDATSISSTPPHAPAHPSDTRSSTSPSSCGCSRRREC
jgi:SAM-dependent methyltransferase